MYPFLFLKKCSVVKYLKYRVVTKIKLPKINKYLSKKTDTENIVSVEWKRPKLTICVASRRISSFTRKTTTKS